MANIVVTTNDTDVNVTSTTSNITVTDVQSNVVVANVESAVTNVAVTTTDTNVSVSQTAFLSNVQIRQAISNTLPILYNVDTGVIGFESNLEDLTLKKYQETVVENGNVSGVVNFNIADGTIHKATVSGNISDIQLGNISAGGSATIMLQQDSGGGHQLDVTAMTDWQWINGDTTIDSNASANSVIAVVYDGASFSATIAEYVDAEDDAGITEIIAGDGLTGGGSTDTVTINAVGGYGVTVTADAIAITNADVQAQANIAIGNNTTDNLSEGSTNLYYTTGRQNTDFDTRFATKTTSDLTEGTNLYFTTARANSAIDNRVVSTTANVDSVNTYTGTVVLDTGDLQENGNLFFTSDRANAATDAFLLSPGTTGNATIGGELFVSGNLEVTGNINYREVTDLLVQDQSITLNYGNASAQDAFIYVDRSGSTLTNAHIKWNEATDNWEINNGTSTFIIPTSTSDLAEGTNLYYTVARANAAIDARVTSLTANVDSVNAQTGVVVLDTGDLQENGNLFYTDARSRAAISATGDISYNSATGVISYSTPTAPVTSVNTLTGAVVLDTDDIGEGLNLYFTNARARQSVSVLSQAPSGNGSLSYNNVNGVFTFTPADVSAVSYSNVDVTNFLTNGYGSNVITTTGNITAGYFIGDGSQLTNLPAGGGYGNVEVANFLDNFGSNSITTTGNITADYFIGNGFALTNITGDNITGNITNAGNITTAGTITAGLFEGDINGAVLLAVHNNTGTRIDKGNVVYLPGGNNGDNPYVDNARADSATTMPAFGIVLENITAGTGGEIVTLGSLTGLDLTGYTTGDHLFVSPTTAGAFQNTAPTSESHLIQSIGKVIKGGSGGALEFTGAGRTNATPNLDEGNMFLGSTSNTSVAVTPSNNFKTLSNAFDLSNAISNVNSITAESSNDFTILKDGKLVVTQGQGSANTTTYTANIVQEGYSVTPSTTLADTGLAYSLLDITNDSSADIVGYAFSGSTTSGSADISITDGGEWKTWRDNGETGGSGFTSDFTTAKSTVGQYYGFQDCYGTSWQQPATTLAAAFPIGAYVVSVDTVGNTITMSENATQSITYTTTQPFITPLSAVDTTTGMVVDFYSDYDLDSGAGTKTAISQTGDGVYLGQGVVFRKTAYGYPYTGFTENDFNWAIGSSSDWTFNLASGTEQFFLRSRTSLDVQQGVFKSPNGIVVGNNTEMSNRGANDPITGFGINVMFDGKDDAISQPADSSLVLPQILFKQYTDNTFQGLSSSTISRGGPRLFFTSATGNIDSDVTLQYPTANQELGRMSFWGSAGNFTTPSSINVPALINVNAHDDWEQVGSVGGNADMHFAATSNKDNGADVFMSYEAGELVLASGKNATSADIVFAPAQQSNNGNVSSAYSGTIHNYAKINYDDVSGETGSKLTIKQGAVSTSAGNLSIDIDREFITGSQTNTVDNPGIFNGTDIAPFVGTDPDTVYVSVFDIGDTFNSIETDGTQVNIAGVTGTASANINGGTWYVKTIASEDPVGDGTAVYLYTDAATTTRASANAIGLSGFTTGGGTVEYAVTGTSAKNWEIVLESDTNDLRVKEDDTTRVTFPSGGGLELTDTITGTNATMTGTVSGDVGDFESVPLKQFTETKVDLGSVSGDQSSALDANNGSIYTMTVTGGITIDSIANVQTGTSMTIIIIQDGTGSHTLSSTMKFAGADSTLSTASGSRDIISVFYDGADYYASLTKGYA